MRDREQLITRAVCVYTEALAEEINFRLLLAQDWHYAVMVVESVSATKITYPKRTGLLDVFRKKLRSFKEKLNFRKRERKESLWQLRNNLQDYRWIS